MLYRLERLLNLRHGDLGRSTLLFSYYFLTIAGYVVANATRKSLFIGRFGTNPLPQANIGVSVFVVVVIAVYLRVARRVALGPLITGSLAAFAGIAGIFWWAIGNFDFGWLLPTLYIWLAIAGLLAITQAWTLANFVLTTREAKRVFGLIGSGGILGGIFGGLMVRELALPVGTENLLLVVAGLLATCAVLGAFIWNQRGRGSEGPETDLDASQQRPGSLRDSLRLVLGSSHLKSIAGLICIGSVVTNAVGWQFDTIASAVRTDDALTVFFGNFEMYAGILAFASQFLITSRVLQRFGLGVALVLLPAALTLGSVGVLMFGNLVAVTLLRGGDKILRYSIDTASLQLLYLPVAPGVKVQVKSFIDTVVSRLGDGLAGVSLMVIIWMGFGPREVAWVLLLFLVGWFFIAHRARRTYLTTLGDRLRRHRVDETKASAPVLDRSTTSMLAARLSSGDTEEILYGLSLFEVGYHQAAHPAMRGLVHHDSSAVRAKVLSILNAAGDTGLNREDLEKLLADDDPKVRVEALDCLTRHHHVDPLELVGEAGGFPELALRSSIVSFLARPGPTQNLDVARIMLDAMLAEDGPEKTELGLEAARIVAGNPAAFVTQFDVLLDDLDPQVVLQVLAGASELPCVEFGPRILKCVAKPALADAVTRVLAGFGSQIVGTLDDHLKNTDVPMAVRRQIPEILLEVGTREAQHVLIENLLQGDTELRFRMIDALNRLRKRRPDLGMDREPLETVMVAELLGHHRSYQAYEALARSLEPNDAALRAFRESLDKEVERVFRLLGLLYPQHDMHAVHDGIGSGDVRLHDNALEFLESILPPDLRALLVPLVDSGVSLGERTDRAKRLVGQEVVSSEEAVRMLISSGDPWLRSCAAYAIGTLGLNSLEYELERMEEDPDPLLAETVRQARIQLAALPDRHN